MTYAPARKKRRWLGPVIVVGVLVLLIVIAFVIAEKLVRDGASSALSAPIKTAFGTESDVAVEFGPGSVILQAFGGSIDSVTVDADNVTLGPSTGRIHLLADGVPLSLNGSISALDATLYLDASGVSGLAPALAGEGATSELVDNHLVVTTQTEVVGQTVPVIVTLTPSAADGVLALTVDALTVNGSDVDVEAAKSGAYGPAVAALVQGSSVCVADKLPASLTLTAASVVDQNLVLGFAGSNVSLSGGGLTSKGTCAA